MSAIAHLSDTELAARLEVPPRVVPALRGARDLDEARALAASITTAPVISLPAEHATLARMRALRAATPELLDEEQARTLVGELKREGGHLRAVRLALTGREHGPELWSVLAALPRDESLARIDAAL